MEIHAFDKTEERVKKLIEFKKLGLVFDFHSCDDNYAPMLKQRKKEGNPQISEEDVEKLTGETFENACYLSSLVDCVMDYGTFHTGNVSKEDYLKENIPLAIFCAELVANQCFKNFSNNTDSELDFDKVSEKLFDYLLEVESKGAKGLKVTRDKQKKMKDIMKEPAFLVVLNRELKKLGLSYNSIEYFNNSGKKTKLTAKREKIKISLKEIKKNQQVNLNC